jgi:acetyl esterase
MPGFAAQTYRNVQYAQGEAGAPLRFDAHIPAGISALPAAIIVHGGGWVAGDRVANVEPLFEPLTQAGFAWFSISYTLAKDVLHLGTAAEDVRAAILYIAKHAAEYHIDPKRIFLVGESAGAQLATLAVLEDAALPIRAIVAIYMPSDLQELAKSAQHLQSLGIVNTALAALVSPRLRGLSPLHKVRREMPPLLLIHGTGDGLIPFQQSVSMCRAVRAVGGKCDLISVRNGAHGIRRWEAAGLTGYKRLMVEWVRKQL